MTEQIKQIVLLREQSPKVHISVRCYTIYSLHRQLFEVIQFPFLFYY
jgi:hypothetical protein